MRSLEYHNVIPEQDTANIYVGMGSNVGDRPENLERAISLIGGAGIDVLASSSIYETEPVGYAEQPWFLNQVIRLSVSKTGAPNGPAELLSCLLWIEKMMGRERAMRGGPRVIDLDLLLYGEAVIGYPDSHGELLASRGAGQSMVGDAASYTPDLVVPHPRLHLRRFVLAPLCELAPNLVHPVIGRTVEQLLESVADLSTVRLYDA